jgi:hypothetical protein
MSELALFPEKPTAQATQIIPIIFPVSSTSIFSAAGALGKPGMVIISPQWTTTKPAPELSEALVSVKFQPLGLPVFFESSDSEA